MTVTLGTTTTVNLGGTATTLDAVTVTAPQVVNKVDVHSTESSTNLSRQDLARMPVDQNIESVAVMAPGVVASGATFGGLSFGGSSVAENAVYINGLNVTDFYNRQGFSTVPFAFFQEFQIKTGGYSVEFGRSTGGVINAVTRSGSNEFHGGIETTFEPAAWRAAPGDHYHADGVPQSRGSQDSEQFYKTNVWASGPIVRDRAFFFLMYEDRHDHQENTSSDGSSWTDTRANNGFWGAKLDWNITDSHLLELLAFSDAADQNNTAYDYDWDSRARGASLGDSTTESGGKNWSATYTGHFTDNFMAKAMYGVNKRHSFTHSPVDEQCSIVSYDSSYAAKAAALGMPLGCYPGEDYVNKLDDKREASRLDFEWSLGDHQLRFGIDREVMTTEQARRYPGDGLYYSALTVVPGQEIWDGSNAYVPAGVTDAVRTRRNVRGGTFETVASAYYIEDNWSLTPDLLLNLGVRVDSFNNKTATGSSFIKLDNLVAPRVGFSWDMKGDGTTKLFGNLGRYYLPVTNNISVTFAGGYTDEYTYYVLQGWEQRVNPESGAAYLFPVLGSQIGPVDTRLNVQSDDLRQSVDRNIKAVYQDEAILGFETAINDAWSWGVNATYRRMTRAMDDIRINHTPCGPTGSTLWPIGNPGESLTIWGDASIGCATEGWITIDTSKDGYAKGGSGEVIGYKDPKRTYKAVEFQIDRAWDDKWALNASYLWSKSEGNFEGPVNSDSGYADTGMVQFWDHPAVNERYGVLFNDHRHQLKLRGSYKLNEQWAFGTTLTVVSGGPITAFGVAWPNDSTAAGSFTNEYSGGGSGWICVENCSGSYADRVFRQTARGAYGRMPWTWTMGASVVWTLPVEGIDLKARFNVYNLFDNQKSLNLHSRYEAAPRVYRDYFGDATVWQSPRYMQLVVSWNF